MKKFIISVDSCVDKLSGELKAKGVYSIILKRIVNGVTFEELYDSYDQYNAFFDTLKNGELPTTSQLNPLELEEHFAAIFAQEKEGDIVHISLSSGLSNTFTNVAATSQSASESNGGRKVYGFDSLSASLGIGLLLDRLIALRDAGVSAAEAVAVLEKLRGKQRLWAIVPDLFHLRRGGRISGVKAAMGTLIGARPVLQLGKDGKLTLERTVKGAKKSIEYLADKISLFGDGKVYLFHAAAADEAALLKEAVLSRRPDLEIVEGMVGPIIGAHTGGGAVALAFIAADD